MPDFDPSAVGSDGATATVVQMKEMSLPTVQALPSLMRKTPHEVQELVHLVHERGDLATIYMQMYYVMSLMNLHDTALEMQAKALENARIFRVQERMNPDIKLLVLMGPGNMLDNTPIELVLEQSNVQIDILFILPGTAIPQWVPPHDISFNAIGESGKNASLLMQLEWVSSHWPTRILNQPTRVMNCARDVCYQLLRGIPGLQIARTQRIVHGDVFNEAYPMTMRPVDTQGGEGLQLLHSLDDSLAYFSSHPAPAYYAAQYINYQSDDGCFRKIRIALIDGRPFVCHLAISSNWMVHYISAGMGESVVKRAEEECFMRDFDQVFVRRHNKALREMSKVLALDYVTVDCAQLPDGRLLVFEVDSRGLIHALDPVALYPYKPAIMQKAFKAFHAMLRRYVSHI